MTDWYILLMLLVFPLFTGFSGYLDLTRSKYLFFVIVTGAWLLLLALCYCLRREFLWQGLRPMTAVVLLYMAVCLLSWIASPYRQEALIGAGRRDGLVTLLLCGGICLGVSANAVPRQRYFSALAVSCLVCSLISVFQLFGYNALGLYPYGLGYYDSGLHYTGAFLGTIGNIDLLCGYYCLAIPAFSAAFLCLEGKARLLFALAAAAGVYVLSVSRVAAGAFALGLGFLILFPVLVSDRSRFLRACLLGALFSFTLALSFGLSPGKDGIEFQPVVGGLLLGVSAVLLLLWCGLSRWGTRPWNARSFRRITLTAELGLVILCLLLIYWIPFQSGTLYELSELLHGRIASSFGSSRIDIWQHVLKLIPERLWFGGGPDTLSLRLDLHYSRYVEETNRTLAVFVDNAHNAYLGYLVNLGILGLISYLACIAVSVWQIWRAGGIYGSILGCGLVCFWLQSFFGLDLCIITPLLWLFWGLACALPTEDRKDEKIHDGSGDL